MTKILSVEGPFNEKAFPQDTIFVDCTGKLGSELLAERDGSKGPLLRAIESNRPIVLKNFDNMSSYDGLAEIAMFLAGETNEVIVYNPYAAADSAPLATYKRSDVGANFKASVIATDPENLPVSLKERLRGILIVPGSLTANPRFTQ